MTDAKIPPLWLVSSSKPVLTSPSGKTFRMSYDRADAARFVGHFFDQLGRRAPGTPALVASSYDDLPSALSDLLGATDTRNEAAFGPMLVMYLGAVMFGVTWTDLGMAVPRG